MKTEQPYEFRKRMLTVHRADLRDLSAQINENETEIRDGFCIILPQNADEVIRTAAKDLSDYLSVSMNVSSVVASDIDCDTNCLILNYDPDMSEVAANRGYRIVVGDGKISASAFDSRGLAAAVYSLEDDMTLRRAPYLEKGEFSRRAMFTDRYAMSGLGMDLYPDEYLSRLAHLGITGLSLWIKDMDLSLAGPVDFNDIGSRAAKYGIDIYLWLYKCHSVHPDDPGADEFYEQLYGDLFDKCPYAKGVVLIGEATQFSSKDKNVGKAPHTANFIDGIPTGKLSPGWWPCYDWPLLCETILKVLKRHRKDPVLILSTYNWGGAPAEERERLIRDLPKEVQVLSSWEMFRHYDLDGCDEDCTDYSLRFAEAGPHFESESKFAKKYGHKIAAITNTTGRTWDYGTIPYMPAPYRWIDRFEDVRRANSEVGLCGLMESIHFGVYPSFIADLEKQAFTLPQKPIKQMLDKILGVYFGEKDKNTVDKALYKWSEAFKYITPTIEDQYGVFRIGPAYPFWIHSSTFPPQNDKAMHKYADMIRPRYTMSPKRGPGAVRVPKELRSIEKTAELLAEGIRILETIDSPNEETERLLNMGRYMYRTTLSGINHKKFYLALNDYNYSSDRDKIFAAVEKIEKILTDERANAEATIPLVENDSILGFEPSMDYVGDKDHLLWKIRQVDYELSRIPQLKELCYK